MSSLKRKSSEYSNSYDSSNSMGSAQKKVVSDDAKRKARRHLYKVCFKDWMALVGMWPALIGGVMPILFIYFSTDVIDALQDWGTCMTCLQGYQQAVEKGVQDYIYQATNGHPELFPIEQLPAVKEAVMAKVLEMMAQLQPICVKWIQYYATQGVFYDPMPVVESCIKKMACICAALAFCQFWNTFFWTLVGSRVQNRMKIAMFSNLMKSEVSYFDVTPIGNVLTLLSEDSEAIQLSFGLVKATQFGAVTQGITGLVMSFIACWQVAFVSIIFIPVVGIALLCIIPSLMKNSAIKFKFVSQSMTIAEETLGSVRTVRGFNREEIETKRFMKATKEAAKRDRNIGLLVVIFLFVVLISIVADILSDFYYGATFVNNGKLQFGELTTLFAYTLLGSMGVVSIQGTMQGEEKCIAAGARILEVAEHVPDIPFDGGEIIEDFKGEIEFKNVSFKYPTRDAYVLKNCSFTIHPKQIGALVGHSGSGKSTCVQLLERFYDATEGLVLLDGHDIRTLDQHWLHQKIALVSQEPVLFRKSLRENIKYGVKDATDEEILEAVEIANAKRVLEKLENGLDTLVGDKGGSLSGGQRQRIAIARAIVKKPTILITDEATSALDAQSEKKVQVALDKVMENCTSVIVAHRLSTIRNAHIIYVFDAGEIKESGTHNDLVAKGGYYYNLVFRQLTDKDNENHQNAEKNTKHKKGDESSTTETKDISDVSTSESD